MKRAMIIASLGLASLLSFGASAAVQQVNAEQAQNLQSMGTISVSQVGSAPMDMRQELAAKAEKEGASHEYLAQYLESYNDMRAASGMDGAKLDAEFAKPLSQGHYDWMIAKGYGAVDYRNDFRGTDNTIWRKLISSPDTLRQRVVLALSEMFVVSARNMPIPYGHIATLAFWDLLAENCFGNFSSESAAGFSIASKPFVTSPFSTG